MEQRPLRLGDIVDDYCPRERRLTNHAIVALVGETIRQTRCTTCEAEHPYKHGKPPRRKPAKDGSSELYDQVLASAPGQLVTRANSGEADASVHDAEGASGAAGESAGAGAAGDETSDEARPDEVAWQGHRPLIRATLPPEAVPATPRPIPEFTMRQPGARGGQRFRQQHYGQHGGGGRPDRNGNQAGGHGGHGQGGQHRHRRRRSGNR